MSGPRSLRLLELTDEDRTALEALTRRTTAAMGLAISRHFCRLMGSDLAVSSVYGQGSTFTVRLPVVVAQTAS
jgi:signal transduction histidine kinase